MGKKVALALGSGGARGYTHIGVIDALEARGYEIIAVSGCSMGAIVGGFYCAGKLDVYRAWVCKLTQFDVIKLLDISLLAGGVIRGDKIFNVVDDMLKGQYIENLSIPFTAVATDLTDHKEVWFQHGPLAQAIRASAAIPSMLSPVEINGHVMVDGAVLNPLPITPCVSAHADLIIAVDLSSDVPMPSDLLKPMPVADGTPWMGALFGKIGSWLMGRNSSNDELIEKDTQLGKIGILQRVIDVMSSALTQYKVAGYPPDLMIKIPQDCCETYEFYRAEEMISLGRRLADLALDAYESGQSSLYSQRSN